MKRRASSPLLLVAAVLLLWTTGRGAMLFAERAGRKLADAAAAVRPPIAPLAAARPAQPKAHAPLPSASPLPRVFRRPPAIRAATIAHSPVRSVASPVRPVTTANDRSRAWSPQSSPPPLIVQPSPIASAQDAAATGGWPLPARRPASGDRWSLSAWAYLRSGGEGGERFDLARLGGSQVGMRVARRLDRAGRVSAFVRLSSSGAIGDGAEAAVGLALRPSATFPAALVIERREPVAGSGGRSAFAAYASGGVSEARLGAALTIDAYAAAGGVGLSRRDLFAEGSAVISHRLARIGAAELAIGGGLWGAAQPGVERLDAGPRLSARLPLGQLRPRVAIDWRQRVAGDAGPDSGVALTIAGDF